MLAAGRRAPLDLNVVHALDHFPVAPVDEFIDQGQVVFVVAVGQEAKPDYAGLRLVDRFEHEADFVFLLGATNEVVPEVKVH